jgi:hypothetical protein
MAMRVDGGEQHVLADIDADVILDPIRQQIR